MFEPGLTKKDLTRVAWSALFAFLGVYVTIITGWGEFKSWDDAKAAIASLLPAALAAAYSAIKNGILADGSKLKG